MYSVYYYLNLIESKDFVLTMYVFFIKHIEQRCSERERVISYNL